MTTRTRVQRPGQARAGARFREPVEIIEPLRPHLHGQTQFPEHRAGVRDQDGAVLGRAFEPGPGRKLSRNDCGQQCNQESCYRGAVSRQKAVCGNYHQEAAIHRDSSSRRLCDSTQHFHDIHILWSVMVTWLDTWPRGYSQCHSQ